jgi:hypothetical protein
MVTGLSPIYSKESAQMKRLLMLFFVSLVSMAVLAPSLSFAHANEAKQGLHQTTTPHFQVLHTAAASLQLKARTTRPANIPLTSTTQASPSSGHQAHHQSHMTDNARGNAMIYPKAKRLMDKVKRQIDEYASNAALEMATIQKANIISRLNKGQGLAGQMRGYSARYKKQRANRGRQVRYRDLQDTGSMIRDLHPELVAVGVARLSFRSATERIKALAHQRRHAWLGVTADDRAILIRLLKAKRFKERQ